MQIYPITTSIPNNYNYHKKPTFTASLENVNSLKSCYFRRGALALANLEGYTEIENLFCKIFDKELKNPVKLLIIGIGNSQETYSYLASIKGIIQNKPLNKAVVLYIVDIQPKPTYEKIRINAFPNLYPYEVFPKYAGKSFIKDIKYPKEITYIRTPIEYYLSQIKNSNTPKTAYRVNDEILNFVYETYNNSQKSQWNSPIQKVIKYFPDGYFDIISANNIFGYISDIDYLYTLANIKRILQLEGYFISDPFIDPLWVKTSKVLSTLKEINLGIYQKI